MTPEIEKALEKISSQLREGMDPEAIYLFGSHGRGDASPDSDLDLMVLVKDSAEPRYRRAQQARAIATESSVPKDIVVLTRDEWERGLRVVASLPSTIAREGRLIYER